MTVAKGVLKRLSAGVCGLLLLTFVQGCASAYEKSVGGNPSREYSRIFFSDRNTVTKAVNEALRSFVKDEATNPAMGIYVTKYKDNTALRNSLDSVGGGDAYIEAKYRLRLSLAEGKFNGLASVRVSVLKEQLVLRDVLEGARPLETDGVDEQTLLYRIGRLIAMEQRRDRMLESKGVDGSLLDGL